MSKVFGPHFQKGLYALKFHLINNLVEDIVQLGPLDLLDSFGFEHFIEHVKFVSG